MGQMNSVSTRLGGVVKAARLDKQLTQKELAGRLSISPHYLMSIENKKKMPGRDLLFLLIRELDIPVYAIFYPEHGRECELLDRLRTLINRLQEHDIEHIIAIMQVLLEAKCAEGGDLQCHLKCPHI